GRNRGARQGSASRLRQDPAHPSARRRRRRLVADTAGGARSCNRVCRRHRAGDLVATPDESDPLFRAMDALFGVGLARQGSGDLGARMLAAIAAANMPALVIGTDCPALTSEHLRAAAGILRGDADAVIIPTEDGGYALIGMRAPAPALFSDMHWSSP